MKETVYNLFYFANDGIIIDLGAVAHELDGTDDEKSATLLSLVETDHKNCQHFHIPLNMIKSGKGRGLPVDSYNALARLGRHLELFEDIFSYFRANKNPLCCITPIVDGNPAIDIITVHSPFLYSKYQGHLKNDKGIMRDYLEDYMTPEGFDLPTLLNNDYFLAIKLLYNHGHYVSCMKLIASCIDTLAFLEYGDISGSFVLWLKEFADLTHLKITAPQLWELRNSILHMSNLDSRKVLTGKERRIGFFVATKGTAAKDVKDIQYFNLIDLIYVLRDAISKWINHLNNHPNKFNLFIERYDTLISDERKALIYDWIQAPKQQT